VKEKTGKTGRKKKKKRRKERRRACKGNVSKKRDKRKKENRKKGWKVPNSHFWLRHFGGRCLAAADRPSE